ncbi:MAG: ATP-dependent Clp protease proteolytic subunit [Verrucomicrobiales bacterium]|nr:ATP-dependent Clp protease proteolytic subunit [Verrucomicrobiales bacterium]
MALHAAAVLLLGLSGCTIVRAPRADSAPSPDQVESLSRQQALDQRRILIFGNLTVEVAERVIEDLFYLDAKSDQPIGLFLMTPGGDLKAAFAIDNALQLVRSPVNTVALAECNSAGAMLLAAGTGKRTAFRGATITIHGMLIKGKPPAEFIELTQSYYTEFWKRRTHLPNDWLPIPRGRTHFLTAELALKYGLIDELLDRKPLPRDRAAP